MQINMRELQFLVSEPVNLNLQILNQFTISLKIAVGKNQPLYWWTVPSQLRGGYIVKQKNICFDYWNIQNSDFNLLLYFLIFFSI